MVYVDDIVIKKSDSRGINDLESFLQTKDLGVLNYLLGIEVMFLKKGIFLSQWKNGLG